MEPITLTVKDAGDITSVDWQAWILNELTMPIPQKEIAKTYSYIIQTNPARHWDIVTINKAIIQKWSAAGLLRIKTMAWRLAKAA